MTKHEKTKEDRLTEGLKLLKDMLDIVKNKDLPAYVELKGRISEWVTTGKPWDGRIEFVTLGRYAAVSLPKTALRAAEITLKASREDS
jgi:hypothetical protein